MITFTINLVFVAGDFDEGDVVCTTWSWVYIGATCMIFLVFSILVVCVLCIYTNRRSVDRENKNRHYIASAQHSIVNGVTDRGMSTPSQAGYYQTQATYRNPHTPGFLFWIIFLDSLFIKYYHVFFSHTFTDEYSYNSIYFQYHRQLRLLEDTQDLELLKILPARSNPFERPSETKPIFKFTLTRWNILMG